MGKAKLSIDGIKFEKILDGNVDGTNFFKSVEMGIWHLSDISISKIKVITLFQNEININFKDNSFLTLYFQKIKIVDVGGINVISYNENEFYDKRNEIKMFLDNYINFNTEITKHGNIRMEKKGK